MQINNSIHRTINYKGSIKTTDTKDDNFSLEIENNELKGLETKANENKYLLVQNRHFDSNKIAYLSNPSNDRKIPIDKVSYSEQETRRLLELSNEQ